MPEVDLGPDEFRNAGRPPPPRPDKVLPAAVMAAGIVVAAMPLFVWVPPTELGVRSLVVIGIVGALAAGWGLAGLLRPYKLIPKADKIRVMEIGEGGRLFDADYHRFSIPYITVLGMIFLGALWWNRGEISSLFLFAGAAIAGALVGIVFGGWLQKREQFKATSRKD